MKEVKLFGRTFVEVISERELSKRVMEMGQELCVRYLDKNPLLLVVLNGAFIFAADLVRHMVDAQPEIQFVKLSSYGDEMESSRNVREAVGFEVEVKDRHVLVIEDVVDTGNSMEYFFRKLKAQNPASLKLVTFLFKPDNLESDLYPDYVGFQIPPAFVVGYGLDYAQKGRELPGIYRLNSSETPPK